MAKRIVDAVTDARRKLGENQTVFWARFGVSQSGGSRYELGREMDLPLKMLVRAWLDGKIDDRQLSRLRARSVR